MSASSKPWRRAMEALLSNGEARPLEEVLAVGAAEVPEERALQEMGTKQSGQPQERRINTGKRNVAMQGVTGMVRFGSHKYVEGKSKIVLAGSGETTSLGELKAEIEELRTQVAALLDFQLSAQAQLDRHEDALPETSSTEAFLAAAGSASS